MKILFLAARFPRPPFKGDQARAFHQLRLLRANHDITLIAFADGPDSRADYQGIEALCSRLIVIKRSRLAALNLLRAPFTRLPFQTLLYSSRAYADAVENELRSGSYDLLHVQLIRMCPYAAKATLPRVVDFIDALSLNMERRAAGDIAILRPVVRMEARRLAAYEREICESFEAAMVVSPVDRDAIGNYPHLHVIPIGVEPEAFH